MAKRAAPEVNAGSMADIAFLLLIFFLVTTTIETDSGINRKLPPTDEVVDPPIIKERNIFNVMINKSDLLLVNGKPSDITLLKDQAKEFLANPYNSEELPEKEAREIEFMPGGLYMVSKGVISLKNDRKLLK